MKLSKQISAGYFKEAKEKEYLKNTLSFLLLFSILSNVFFTGEALYILTFVTLVLQFFYMLISKDVKNLNIQAKNAHKQELFYFLFENPTANIELSNMYSTLKPDTINWLEQNKGKIHSTVYTSPPEISRIKMLYWMIQENCFWNKNLFKQAFNRKAILLGTMTVIAVIAFSTTAASQFIPWVELMSIKNEFIQIDKFSIPRFIFIILSSFLIIEQIEMCLDLLNGSKSMEGIENQILRYSKRVKIDELMNVLSEYYSVLLSTPNISNNIYKKHADKLNKGWDMRCKSIPLSNPKKEIIDCLKTLNGLVCDEFNWCVIGSSSLFLQGVPINPNDIDILTDEQGIKLIKKHCSPFIYEDMNYKQDETKTLKSIHGRLVINHVNIDIISSIENLVDGRWISHDNIETHKVSLKEGCFEVNLRSIAYEKEIYQRIGDESKLKILNQ